MAHWKRILMLLLLIVLSAIVGIAYWYRLPLPEGLKIPFSIIWAILCMIFVAGEFFPWRKCSRVCFLLVLIISLAWWTTIKPSNDRIWADDVAHTVTGTISGHTVTLHNVRNFTWRALDDYDQKWETHTYDLSKLTSVDLFLSTWGNADIAHTLVSFGFKDGQYVTFSVEIRKERHEKFSEVAGFFKQYEIALIAADENDIIRTRTNARKEDVSLYRVLLSPEKAQELFLSYLERGNDLAQEPAFYNTLTSNCTTVVFDMVRLIVPTIPMDYRILFSGRLPSYIYDLGGLGRSQTLEELSAYAHISTHAQKIGEKDNFSRYIRQLNQQ